jgi:ABC-type transporter MlaC component
MLRVESTPRILALVLALLPATPIEAASASPREGGEGRPAKVCAPDASGARLAVELAFAELVRLHRGRVPGPSGQDVLNRLLDRLLERFVRFERFVDDALGEAWDSAPERRRDWQESIANYLRQRYLDRLGSPVGARIEVKSVRHQCDEARVAMVVHGPGGSRRKTDVELRLVVDPPHPSMNEVSSGEQERTRPEPFGPMSWRSFDVSVDGVSLLETWKSRFRRIYADGGVAAIDEHLRNLSNRYPGRTGIP